MKKSEEKFIIKHLQGIASNDKNGFLTPLSLQELSHPVKRIYWITDINAGDLRGKHAHKKEYQTILVLSGSIIVQLNEYEYNLKWNDYISIPPFVRVIIKVQANSIILVLSSEEYNPEDYIHDSPNRDNP